MGMRITTNMIRRNYTNNLMDNIGGLERARQQVETGRRFQWSYEDPAAAAKGMILERRHARNEDYIDTVKNTQKWIDSQSDILNELSGYANQIDESEFMSALNDPTGTEGRTAYAQNLRALQESLVHALNTQYGDTFIMAGTDGRNVPFDLDGGKLTYQGIDVNDAEAMKKLTGQTQYVDIGFGTTFYPDGHPNAGEIVPSSAFDMAFPGILAVGYGTTNVKVYDSPVADVAGKQDVNGNEIGDGVIDDKDSASKYMPLSNNIIVLAGQMADVLEKEPLDRELCEAMWNQFKSGREELQNQFARVGTKAQLLENTLTRLDQESQNIKEQYQDAIGIDPALAITNETYAKYSYDAALKIGTSLLGNSLLDFMD